MCDLNINVWREIVLVEKALVIYFFTIGPCPVLVIIEFEHKSQKKIKKTTGKDAVRGHPIPLVNHEK